jgi:hypothetical protein
MITMKPITISLVKPGSLHESWYITDLLFDVTRRHVPASDSSTLLREAHCELETADHDPTVWCEGAGPQDMLGVWSSSDLRKTCRPRRGIRFARRPI